jgi:hypothetical protein
MELSEQATDFLVIYTRRSIKNLGKSFGINNLHLKLIGMDQAQMNRIDENLGELDTRDYDTAELYRLYNSIRLKRISN